MNMNIWSRFLLFSSFATLCNLVFQILVLRFLSRSKHARTICIQSMQAARWSNVLCRRLSRVEQLAYRRGQSTEEERNKYF